MPINPRPRTLIDLFTRLSQGSVPSATLGQIVHSVIATRAGVTNLGLAAVPSIARATTWIAIGSGNLAFDPSQTALQTETARAPVLPFLSAPAQTIALALMSSVRGNGAIWEIGLFGPGSHGAPSIASGSGTLYVRAVLVAPQLKYAGKVTTVSWAES